RAHDFTAERLPERLMTEAHAEDRDRGGGLVDEIEADARFIRGAWAGREHDGVRIGLDHVRRRKLVVAVNHDLRAQLTQIVEQVEGEAVVIVDQDDHGTGSLARGVLYQSPRRVMSRPGPTLGRTLPGSKLASARSQRG